MPTYAYASKQGLQRARSWSTPMGWSLMAFFVVSYLFSAYDGGSFWSQSSDALIMHGANYAPLTWYGQEWRLFTHIFLHTNVFHLLVNTLALWAVWKRSAVVFHSGTQLYIFLVCGVVSGWVGATQQFDSVSVGSSGAILGLLCSVVGWGLARSYIRREVKKAVAGFPMVVVPVVLVAGFFLPGMDAYANVGGALAGLFFGIFISSKSEQEHGLVTAIVLTGVTIALVCAAVVFSRPSQEKMQRFQREQVSEKALEYIHEVDRKAELAMKRLWETPGPQGGVLSEQRQADAKAWRLSWHAHVVLPLESNAAMASGLLGQPQDAHFGHLQLLRQYTAARLQEARLLEINRERVQAIGTPVAALRERIVELNRQMQVLSDPGKLELSK